MLELLEEYENKSPEIVFEWKDSETEAEGWVVINSLRGGAAGGGTRMRVGLDKREVESLAKTMEVKFTVSGPPIGGAKSGINFDPRDPRKDGVLRRWFKAVIPLLKNYYGTGGDLNIDEIKEVIPVTEDYGLWHPQEGVVNGHFKPEKSELIHKIGQLRMGVSKVVEDSNYSPDPARKYVVADLITGYGVAESVKHYYDIWGGSIQGKRVIVQGWGNVGAAAGYYCSKLGAKVVGIIDRSGGVINENGFHTEKVRAMFVDRDGNMLQSSEIISFDEVNDRIWDVNADVFLPCAASRLLSQDQVDRMIKAGIEVMSCGANVPFADPEIFFGPIAASADNRVSIIPDFISNCGMARVFAYLMGREVDMTDQAIFDDTSRIIKEAMVKVHAKDASNTKIAQTAFEIALNQLMN